ncbi:hypothetical protein HDU97_004303 [Phlyctochytrium planicorne]|nr:hypothetical protein HDU97_004303 [Phlyctochytrium planicorne]
MSTDESTHVFISYAWSNSHAAHLANPAMPLVGPEKADPRKLANALIDRGYRVWLDILELRAGKDLHAQLAAALDKASVAVVCISDEYCQSKNCNLEISYICDLSLPIIQAVVGKSENNAWRKSAIKFKIGSPLYIDFRQEQDAFEDKLNELLMALKEHGVVPIKKEPEVIVDNIPVTAASAATSFPPPPAQFVHQDTTASFMTTGTGATGATSATVEEDPLAALSPEEKLLAYAEKGDVKNVRKVLADKRVNIEAKGTNGWTALNSAAYNGHLETVNLLLKHKAKMDSESSTGWTPLASACLMGHLDVVQFLVVHGSNLEHLTSHKWSPLYAASYSGHTDVVSWLLSQGANINAVNDCGWFPLSSAANSGHFETVKVLVEEGRANLEGRNDDGSTPIFLAAMNNHLDIVEYLFNAGADPGAQTHMLLTPLHASASLGFIEVVSFLIDVASVNIDAESKHGWSPLHAAAFSGHLEVTRELLKAGMKNIDLKNQDGATPFYLAASKNYLGLLEVLKSYGASFHSTCKKGWTPLMAAAANGAIDSVEWLVEVGAAVNAVDLQQKTALHLAVENHHLEVVSFLIENSFSIASNDLQDENGMTPLMLACIGGQPDIAKELIDKGANKSKKNKDGKTALQLAEVSNNPGLMDLFGASARNSNSLRHKGSDKSKKVHPTNQEADKSTLEDVRYSEAVRKEDFKKGEAKGKSDKANLPTGTKMVPEVKGSSWHKEKDGTKGDGQDNHIPLVTEPEPKGCSCVIL